MAESSFPTAHKHVLAYEGGYSNHPADTGGVTLNGIIQRVYDAWRKKRGLPQRALTPKMNGTPEWIAERDAIYRENYWFPVAADRLEPGVDGAVYDYGVNSGIGRAARVLQRLVGVPEDGRVGSATVEAANKRDPEALAHAICEERQQFYNAIVARKPSQKVFLAGWTSRRASVDKYTKSLAAAYKAGGEASVGAPAPVDGPMARGQVPEPKTAKNIIKAAPPAAAAEEAARDGHTWLDWIGAHPLETVLVGLAVIVAAAVAVHFINAAWRREQVTPAPGTSALPEVAK